MIIEFSFLGELSFYSWRPLTDLLDKWLARMPVLCGIIM